LNLGWIPAGVVNERILEYRSDMRWMDTTEFDLWLQSGIDFVTLREKVVVNGLLAMGLWVVVEERTDQ
jgi:hypothetical protein